MAKGDQIYAWREFAEINGVYQHHGIDCGDGSVIHYRKPSEIIERTSMATFSRGSSIYLRQYVDGFCFIPEVVVMRAESRLGERDYNLLFNNCEHFATWCKTGISYSNQIRDFIPFIHKLDTYQLSRPLKTALEGVDRYNANNMIDKALADIRVVWEQIQPQYKKAREEADIWERVAREALKKNREDLAKEALKRKLNCQKIAQDLEKQLEDLASMTENLLKNH